MRTTLDLPDELLKRANVEAIERGTTLRDLLGAALERELRQPGRPRREPARKRAQFPIFDSNAPGSLRLTNAEIAKLEGEEDARRQGEVIADRRAALSGNGTHATRGISIALRRLRRGA